MAAVSFIAVCAAGFGSTAPVAAERAAPSSEHEVAGNTVVAACAGDTDGGVPLVSEAGALTFEGVDGARYFATDLRLLADTARRVSAGSGLMTGAAKLSALPVSGPNRWGLVPAWIVRQDRDGTLLLQTEILESGEALFAPYVAAGDCADLLRATERTARRARSGHWRDADGNTLFSTFEPETFAGYEGRYVIARGRVVSLGKTASTRYLNFGRHWKSDLTVTLKSSEESMFNSVLGQSGHKVDDLEGHSVEVRGVLQERDGPYIALRHPEQLVVLEHKRVVSGGQDGN
ncbi:hypothetical protein [Roseibium sp. MMSF_3412]|uniref:hypothetical protein n=1 Tax=Roseibium sp. MMSF_3412 TaxID=3046712 RepID=UPI00273E3A36|nr:hypothetical protein [Roseibium sp. MMSF_3412]